MNFDGVWLEGEHGPLDFADIGNLGRACDLWGMSRCGFYFRIPLVICVYVRVPLTIGVLFGGGQPRPGDEEPRPGAPSHTRIPLRKLCFISVFPRQ
jgi:hypothetical protein